MRVCTEKYTNHRIHSLDHLPHEFAAFAAASASLHASGIVCIARGSIEAQRIWAVGAILGARGKTPEGVLDTVSKAHRWPFLVAVRVDRRISVSFVPLLRLHQLEVFPSSTRRRVQTTTAPCRCHRECCLLLADT